ncbi:hypothetical protein TNCV_2465821 [Trichonephila clavipes]|uniref:Uncharacterized protein n=1 Tax=Trichonephila clavipes TaxID=2585209 RepID=A0A8X6UZK9_TRICX|nr:hypothetical protein TNCV_2465821 [Trichonephila clavipes]
MYAQQLARNMRDANRFQIKKEDFDSPGISFTGEIALSKRRICYRSFAETSFFETVTTVWPPRSANLKACDF